MKRLVGALGVLLSFAVFCAVDCAYGRSISFDLRQKAPSGLRMTPAKALENEGVLRSFDLEAGLADAGEMATGDELTFALFDDVTITLALGEKLPSPLGGDVFLAEAAGCEGVKNAVVLRTADGLTIDVQDCLNDRVYKVVSSSDGVKVQEIKPPRDIACETCAMDAPTVEPSNNRTIELASDQPIAADGATYIDILMAYDKNAAKYAAANGGGVTNFASVAVAKMNTAIANTGLTSLFRFRLVGVVSVQAQTDNLSTAVANAQSGATGWEAIRTERDRVGADIVSVLISTAEGSGSAGLGYSLVEAVDGSYAFFSEHPYNACDITSVASSHTMTHECGHNMGCGHASEQTSQPGPQLFDYSAGYYFTGGDSKKYCTIMAYPGQGPGGTRVPYFSSPSYKYQSTAVGDAKHDNTRTIRQTYLDVSKFRAAKANEVTAAAAPVWTVEKGVLTAVNLNGCTDVTIPSSVTNIGYAAFNGCSGLKKATIPSSVTNIANYAFYNCTSLANVTIGNSVKAIGEGAFAGCSKLTSVTIGKAVKTIGQYAFYECSGLANVTIPDSVATIGQGAFSGCSGLASVTIPQCVCTNNLYKVFPAAYGKITSVVISDAATAIGYMTFADCSSLEYVKIGKGVKTIGDYAFLRCENLADVTMGNAVTAIGAGAFAGCANLADIDIPDSVSSIGKDAFSGCSGLTDVAISQYVCTNSLSAIFPSAYDKISYVDISDSVMTIGDEAFRGCIGLVHIDIPDTVTTIGDGAFRGCIGLDVIHIPDSVTTIGNYAFSGCASLMDVSFDGSDTTIKGNAFSGCTGLMAVRVHGSGTIIESEAFSGCTGLMNVSFDGSDTTIKSNAFSGCTGLSAVDISGNGTTIGSEAFSGCTNLTDVVIGSGATIGDRAFYNCTDLRYVVMEGTCPTVGNDAFAGVSDSCIVQLPEGDDTYVVENGKWQGMRVYGASEPVWTIEDGVLTAVDLNGYTEVTIPGSVTRIGASSFKNCAGLTSVTIPDSVTSIGAWAFLGCSGLTDVTIGNSVAAIGNGAFSGCSSLAGISIPGSVASVGERAFNNCNAALYDTMTIAGAKLVDGWAIGNNSPSGILDLTGARGIGNNAFSGCNDLTYVKIGDTATTIGERAFYMCTNLKGVEIGGAVTSIGAYAFEYCYYLADVTIPNSVTSIGDRAFYGCALEILAIPESVTSIGDAVFYGCSSLRSVAVPDSIAHIGSSAFSDCGNLACVAIGNSVTNIGAAAFARCENLMRVMMRGDCPAVGGNAFSGIHSSCIVYLPEGNGTYVVEDGKWLGLNVEYYCVGGPEATIAWTIKDRMLTAVDLNGCAKAAIPDYVAGIGDFTFASCIGLTDVTIPHSATNIGSYAFAGCSGLKSVSIGNSVSVVGPLAFHNCDSLASLTLPDSVAMIGYRAFESCDCLTDVAIPDFVAMIGNMAFQNCAGLTSVTIGGAVTNIGNRAFYGCSGLTSVTMKGHCPKIGTYAFEKVPASCIAYLPEGDDTYVVEDGKWQGMTVEYYSTAPEPIWTIEDGVLTAVDLNGCTEVTIPASVATIGEAAFSNCTALASVKIPSSVTTIESSAFESCTGLTSLAIPDSVAAIGDYAFFSCTNLTSVAIGNSVVTIGEGAFAYCIGLTGIRIPDSVADMGEFTFYGCSGLTDVKIGSTVTTVGAYAFRDCTNLTNVTIPDSAMAIGEGAFAYCSGLTGIKIPDSVTTIGDYAFYYCSGLANVAIPDSVASIGIWAFYNCGGLANATIGNSVTNIGEHAFSGCSGLTSVTIPDSVTNIGNSAFSYCSGLTSVTIPDSVTAIGQGAFSDCTGLTSVAIPYSVTNIGNSAFSYCSGLTSVAIPDSVATIGKEAFYRCGGLTSVTIPDSVTAIGEAAFSHCAGLMSVTIPDSVTTIGKNAFSGCTGLKDATICNSVIGLYEFSDCTGLTSVAIHDSVKEIDWYAFSGCSSLASIAIPDSVTRIGIDAFRNCTGLTSVAIGDSVKTVDGAAFYGCTNLTDVVIGSAVTKIDEYAFVKCSSLANIVIPDSVKKIGDYVFKDCTNLASVTLTGNCPAVRTNAFYDVSASCIVYLPEGDDTYVVEDGKWQGMTVEYYSTAPEPVWTIEDGVLTAVDINGCTEVTIPASVTNVSYSAFQGCTNLVSISVAAGNECLAMKGSVLYNLPRKEAVFILYNATDAVIESGTEKIAPEVFSGRTKLANIKIPDSVMNVGYTSGKRLPPAFQVHGDGYYTCDGWVMMMDDANPPLNLATGATPSGTLDLTAWRGIAEESFDLFIRPPLHMKLWGKSFENVTVRVSSGCHIGAAAFDCWQDVNIVRVDPPVATVWIVTFNAQGGAVDGAATRTVADGDAIGELPSATRTGYVFDGWFYAPDGASQVSASDTIQNDTTLYAHWSQTAAQPIWTIEDGVLTAVDLNGCTEATIPNSVTNIGSYAFYHCATLTSVTIPDSVTTIEEFAFSGCSGLTSVTIPDSVMTIGREAFSGCSGLTSVTIPDSVTSIAQEAFSGCSGLTSFAIGGSVANIGSYAFTGCSGLTEFNVAEYNTAYKTVDGALLTKDGATLVCVPGGRTGSLTIPDTVETLEVGSLDGCTGLTNVTIPDSVRTIAYRVFRNCSGLTSVTIPKSVGVVHYEAFAKCASLTSVTMLGNCPSIVGGDVFAGVSPECVVHLPEISYSYDVEDGKWQGLRVYSAPESEVVWTIEDGVLTAVSLDGCTKVTIPDSVTTIGEKAFYGRTGLTSVTIPNSVTKISREAFFKCTGLTSVTIGESVTDIEPYAFYTCSSLTSIVIPASVGYIGYEAFSKCSSLTSIVMLAPFSRRYIGYEAFYECSSLASVTMKGDCPSMGDDVFGNVPSECVVYLPEGNDTYVVEDGKWHGMKVFGATTKPEPVWTITDGVLTAVDLNGCTEVTIPASVTNVSYSAFRGCTNLVSISVAAGNSAVAMKGSVLYNLPRKEAVFILYNATDAVIESGTENIAPEVFSGRTKLANVKIPDSVTNVSYTSGKRLPPAFQVHADGYYTCDGWVMMMDDANPPLNLATGATPSGTLDLTAYRGIAEESFDLFIRPPLYMKLWGKSFENVTVRVSSACHIGAAAFDCWQDVNIVRGDSPVATVWTVTFDAQGGTGGTTRQVESGKAVGTLPTATRNGYTFNGWFTSAEGGTKVTASTVVTAAVTYYAQWKKNEDEGGGEGGGEVEPPAPCYEMLEADDIVEPYAVPKAVKLYGAVYDGCDVAGIVELKLGKVNAKKGIGKVAGTVTTLDGKKHSAKAFAISDIDGVSPKSVLLDVKDLGTMDLVIGGESFAGSLGDWHVQSSAVGGAWSGTSVAVTVDVSDLSMFSGTVLTSLLPANEQADVNGAKWVFAKAAGVKWAKPKKGAEMPEIYDEESGKGLYIDTSGGKTNLSGLKLTYAPKKGTFKGTFKVYVLEGSGKSVKLKKYSVKASGFVIDGKGKGSATCKKPVLNWPVTIK